MSGRLSRPLATSPGGPGGRTPLRRGSSPAWGVFLGGDEGASSVPGTVSPRRSWGPASGRSQATVSTSARRSASGREDGAVSLAGGWAGAAPAWRAGWSWRPSPPLSHRSCPPAGSALCLPHGAHLCGPPLHSGTSPPLAKAEMTCGWNESSTLPSLLGLRGGLALAGGAFLWAEQASQVPAVPWHRGAGPVGCTCGRFAARPPSSLWVGLCVHLAIALFQFKETTCWNQSDRERRGSHDHTHTWDLSNKIHG